MPISGAIFKDIIMFIYAYICHYFIYITFRSNKVFTVFYIFFVHYNPLYVFYIFFVHYNPLLCGYNEFCLSTIHYNHLFFVWLIMNCVDYKNTKNAHILILLLINLK